MPAISVILPTYNRATVLRRAVDSVLAQDFADFGITIVDDSSADALPTLKQSYRDPHIIYVGQPVNRSGNACRNHGIMPAQSEIIRFLDSDDAYLPYKLSFVAAYFAHHLDIDVLVDSFDLTIKELRRGLHLGRIQGSQDSGRVERSVVLPVCAYLPVVHLYGRDQAPSQGWSLFQLKQRFTEALMQD